MLGLISGVAVAAPDAEGTPAKAAECQSSPKGAAPSGERWFYRVERGSKRHCWYTRGGATGRMVAHRPRLKPEAKADPSIPPPEPLQLSVANARAEASIVPPAADARETSSNEAPRNPNWTLADRWSQTGGEPAPAPSQSVTQSRAATSAPAPALPISPPSEPAAAETADDGFIGLAAAVVALLGLAIVLVAVLLRRRRREDADDSWKPAAPQPFTDLNDRPLMTWRKGLQDQLQRTRGKDREPDETPRRSVVSSTDVAVLPRRRTGPPAARA